MQQVLPHNYCNLNEVLTFTPRYCQKYFLPECYLGVLKYYLPEKFLDVGMGIIWMQLHAENNSHIYILFRPFLEAMQIHDFNLETQGPA